jgi:hypothetical protein
MSSCALLILAVFASYAAAQPIDSTAPRATWVNMTKLNAVVTQGGCASCHAHPPVIGAAPAARDSFVMQGYFNLAPNSVHPAAVDVSLIADPLQWDFPSGSWTRVGKSGKYKARVNNVSAQIDYWVGGSSRCNFTFIATKQVDMSQPISHEFMTMELKVGTAFDESFEAMVTPHGKSVSLVNAGGGPTFALDSVTITRNRKKANSDSIKVAARSWGVDDFDPGAQDIEVDLGSFHAILPAGSLVLAKNGKTANYKGPLPGGGSMVLTIGLATSTVAFTISKVDLSGVTEPCDFAFDMVGTNSGRWGFSLQFQENKTHTVLKY